MRYSIVFRVEEPVMDDEAVQLLKKEDLGKFKGWLHKESAERADAAEFAFDDLEELLDAMELLLSEELGEGRIEVKDLEVIYERRGRPSVFTPID